MRVTKSQLVIMDLLRDGSAWDDGCEWFCSAELVSITGRSQQSINRSLNTLIKNNMVERKIEAGDRTLPNTWSYAYRMRKGF